MYVLRRLFQDGSDRPELVLIHYSASPENSPDVLLVRSTAVVVPTGIPGTRQGHLFLSRPPEGGRLLVRYLFSTVCKGGEWFSSVYDVALPGPDTAGDLKEIEVEGEGNAVPAPGRGVFRLALPLRPDEPRTGSVRFGFGAMRKKPSLSLCRARLPLAPGEPPILEIPECLSVLKNYPMPFFLYHAPEGGTAPFADKINGARITFRDDQGDCVLACALWGDRSWAAHNLTVMELKDLGAPAPGARASEYYHSGDRETFLRTRAAALALHPIPRTFEGFVFGPSGSVAEYCFLVLRIRDGALVASWENAPSGRNWEITL